jgi:hypothetical protein
MSTPSVIPAATATSAHMFVSTALDLWWTDRPEGFARDFQINDTVYRRLDPEYFAWLRTELRPHRCLVHGQPANLTQNSRSATLLISGR